MRRALNLFVAHAQARIADIQIRREGLERERQVQQLRLRQARTRAQSLAAADDAAAEIEAIERSLAENTTALEALGGALATLDDYLDQVRTVFARPEDHLGVATVAFRINRMGVKLDDQAPELGSDLSLLELSMGPVRRVITLVRCPREELLSVEEFLGQVSPYVAAQMGIRATDSRTR
jgi:chromosome segregation ATPase